MNKDIIDLLKPRYKVITDYPNSIFKVNSILETNVYGEFDTIKYYNCSDYPHIFKPLKWWEERKVEEMPEYVKIAENRPSYKLPNNCIRSCTWQKTINECGFICDSFPVYLDVKGLLPATEQEYLSYIEGLKK